MIKLGFIGYGSMGNMLVNKMIESNNILPEEIIVSTRTNEKLSQLKCKYSNINISENNFEVISEAKYIFLCVKPLEMKKIIRETLNYFTQEKILISISAVLSIENIEKIFYGKIAKVIPTVISEVNEGVTLTSYNSKVDLEDKEYIKSLFENISVINEFNEEQLELATEFSSCAPGFIASIFQEFLNEGTKFDSNIPRRELEEIIIRTLMGTAKLMLENQMGLDEVIKRVATKGGITEEGIVIFREKLPEVYKEVFEKTLEKRMMLKNKANQD